MPFLLARPEKLPTASIGPHPQWSDPDRIVSLDPWGHRVAQDFAAVELHLRRPQAAHVADAEHHLHRAAGQPRASVLAHRLQRGQTGDEPIGERKLPNLGRLLDGLTSELPEPIGASLQPQQPTQ